MFRLRFLRVEVDLDVGFVVWGWIDWDLEENKGGLVVGKWVFRF